MPSHYAVVNSRTGTVITYHESHIRAVGERNYRETVEKVPYHVVAMREGARV